MKASDIDKAAILYARFRKDCPREANPTDLNTEAKWRWMVGQGFEAYVLMQRARKASLAFTKWPKKVDAGPSLF